MNAGQTCMAPDYCFVHEKVYDRFLQHLKVFTEELYSKNAQTSPDLSRPVNKMHYERIKVNP